MTDKDNDSQRAWLDQSLTISSYTDIGAVYLPSLQTLVSSFKNEDNNVYLKEPE